MEQEDELNHAIKIDNLLTEYVKGIDTLKAVAPLNYDSERKRFFDSNFAENPKFKYTNISIDPFKVKRQLFNLPIEHFKNEDLYVLYRDVIESYAAKASHIGAVGTSDFLYASLKHYGEPTEKDLNNARFILHLPDDLVDSGPENLTSQDIVARCAAFAQRHGYAYDITLKDGMIAKALVSGSTVNISRTASISEIELEALVHHELGVHLVTTLNARAQPLSILSLGCPLHTMTQEGIAILCEYLAGCMTLSRIKVLALRVLAVQSLLQEKEFKKTFLMLKEDYHSSDAMAFTITARVYRGGGFTKDYLYLRGVRQMLNAYETRKDFIHLLCGKVSIDYLAIINRLIEAGMLVKPNFISPAITHPVEQDEIRKFIAHAIR